MSKFNIDRSIVDSDSEILTTGIYAAYAQNCRLFGDGDLPSVYLTLLVSGRKVHGCWLAPTKRETQTPEEFSNVQLAYSKRVVHLMNALKVPNSVEIETGLDLARVGSSRHLRVELMARYSPVMYEGNVVTKAIYEAHQGDAPLKADRKWTSGRLFRLCRNRDGYALYNIRRTWSSTQELVFSTKEE